MIMSRIPSRLKIDPLPPVYPLQVYTVTKSIKKVYGDKEIVITDVFTLYDKNGNIKDSKMTNSKVDYMV